MRDFRAGGRLGLRASDVTAFGNTKPVRVVEIPAGLRLFKLTAGQVTEHPIYGVTPWWSPVLPYRDDHEGALGRLRQAKLNKINMSAMVRYMSAVCFDWNALDNYVEVTTKVPLSAFWGTFAPQNKWSGPINPPAGPTDVQTNALARKNNENNLVRGGQNDGAQQAYLPPQLGVLEAWQFYIPKLRDAHIQRGYTVDARDMNAMSQHLDRGVARL